MGAKAKSMIASFNATCVSVKSGSPSQRLLHTNTIAVQGATPSRIMPAMYSLADCGSTHGAKMYWKNSTPRAAMVKGLMSQFTTRVSSSPCGRLPTSLMARQSTWIIIG